MGTLRETSYDLCKALTNSMTQNHNRPFLIRNANFLFIPSESSLYFLTVYLILCNVSAIVYYESYNAVFL